MQRLNFFVLTNQSGSIEMRYLPLKDLEQVKTIKGLHFILRLSKGFTVGYELPIAFSAKSPCAYTLPSASEMPSPKNAVPPQDARQFIPFQG
jgi:hypothetical protein